MDANIPADLYYTREHEWGRMENGVLFIGITDFAQESLGDIVFIDLPNEGADVQKDEGFGVIESVKAVSDLYAPISGEVIEVNDALPDSPEVINDDPYEEGWMLKMRPSDEGELKGLMSAEEYAAYVSEEQDE